MTDSSEQGAAPAEDAVVDEPRPVDDGVEQQRREHPEQARASTKNAHVTDEEAVTQAAGGEIVGRAPDGGPAIEGPNSA